MQVFAQRSAGHPDDLRFGNPNAQALEVVQRNELDWQVLRAAPRHFSPLASASG
jgi:hypothetical protein